MQLKNIFHNQHLDPIKVTTMAEQSIIVQGRRYRELRKGCKIIRRDEMQDLR